MQTHSKISPPFPVIDRAAPALMAIGLSALIAQLIWPVFLVATAVSLVALGATSATTVRQHHTASPGIALAVHLFVYICLYLLFIGAICDASARGPNGGLTLAQTIDLGLSAGVMAFVARTCIAEIVGDGDAPTR